MPVVLAAWEDEAGGAQVWSQLQQFTEEKKGLKREKEKTQWLSAPGLIPGNNNNSVYDRILRLKLDLG